MAVVWHSLGDVSSYVQHKNSLCWLKCIMYPSFLIKTVQMLKTGVGAVWEGWRTVFFYKKNCFNLIPFFYIPNLAKPFQTTASRSVFHTTLLQHCPKIRRLILNNSNDFYKLFNCSGKKNGSRIMFMSKDLNWPKWIYHKKGITY